MIKYSHFIKLNQWRDFWDYYTEMFQNKNPTL